jgi:hypothetical protein
MSSETSIEQLQRDLGYLKDRLAIQDVVMRHARGVDRHDVDLMNSCYHEDGVARYGPAVIQGPDYGEWSNGAHVGRFRLHSHNITNLNTDIEGDVAYCESYVMAVFLSSDQKRSSLVSGRYFDQLKRRDGEWRIAVRRTVIDICLEGDASFLGAFRGSEVDESDFWSQKDMSYKRPLDIETEVPKWH